MNKSVVIHPLLFAVYPVLSLYANNIGSALLSEALVPIAVALGVALLLFSLLSLVLRNTRKAGLIVSLFLLLFFSYGHIHSVIDGLVIGPFDLGRPRYLLLSSAIVFVLGAGFCLKTRRDLHNLTRFVNIVAASLVVMSLISIGAYKLKTRVVWQDDRSAESGEAATTNAGEAQTLPDIYYIILDGYASSSTLQEIYGYDNCEFTSYLEDAGFYVASESVSNYASTFLSLSSSLNMEYVNYLSDTLGVGSQDRSVPYQMIRNSKAMRLLKERGYKFVNFRSGWGPTDRNQYADLDIACGIGNEFLTVLVQTTMLDPFGLYLRDVARERVQGTFSKLAEVTHRIEGPRFVLAHITVPHPPYLFGANGEPVADTVLKMSGWVWTQTENYVNQLIFVNKKVEMLVDEILSNSEVPPIVVLQADHGGASTFSHPKGPGWEQPTEIMLKERMRIFNAYYLPQGGSDLLYDSITPVNTFRLIFDYYLHTDYGLLDDQSYYSSYRHPYQLVDVTDKVKYD